MRTVIRWKKDAARIPAACAVMLVVLGGSSLIRMSVKARLAEQRGVATALAADAGARITAAIGAITDRQSCARNSATHAAIIRAIDTERLTGSSFDYELRCATPGGGPPKVVARSANHVLVEPVLHSSHAQTSEWTIALAPRFGWLPWRLIAVQSLLVFVTALFALLATATLARRPEQLRGELRARDERLKVMHRRLAAEIRQREVRESHAGAASRQDAAIGLASRGYLIDRLAGAQLRARQDRTVGVAVIVISLERLTPIADDRWKSADDELLAQAGRRLEYCLRTREHTVARAGDNSVGVVLADVISRQALRAEAELWHQALAAAFPIGGRLLFVHPSIGIALAASPDQPAEELLRAAQLAVEKAIDNFRVASNTISARSPQRAELAGQYVPAGSTIARTADWQAHGG